MQKGGDDRNGTRFDATPIGFGGGTLMKRRRAKPVLGSLFFLSHLIWSTSGAPAVAAAEFVLEPGRLPLEMYLWSPPKSTPPRAVVLAVHGTTQHAGSFETLASQLAEQGFLFYSLDLRGHGKRFYESQESSPHHTIDYEKSAQDLVMAVDKLRRRHAGLPLFCIGESVGAGVATEAAARGKGLIDGLILCSAGTRPCLLRFNPFLVVPDFVKGITRLDRLMDVSRYILRYSADDRRVSEEMVADPLSRIKLTPREILRTGWFIRKTPESAKRVAPEIPVLIVQGGIDNIVSAGSVKAIMRNLPTSNKSLVTFPNYGHVLLGTSYLKPKVVETVKEWLLTQSDATVPAVSTFSLSLGQKEAAEDVGDFDEEIGTLATVHGELGRLPGDMDRHVTN